VPEEEVSAHLKSVMNRVQDDRAEEVAISGFRRLREQGVHAVDGINSPDFLPKQILLKGLGEGFAKEQLQAAMHRLMTAGTFKRQVIGRYAGNRSERYGLALAGEPASGSECTK